MPVEVELRPLVDADDRVRLPEHDCIETTEAGHRLDEVVSGEALRGVVEQPLVPQPHQGDGEARLGPPGRLPVVGRAVVGPPLPRRFAPLGESFPPARPVIGGCRGREDLGPVGGFDVDLANDWQQRGLVEGARYEEIGASHRIRT